MDLKLIADVKFDKTISEGYKTDFCGSGYCLDNNQQRVVFESNDYDDRGDLLELLGRNKNHRIKN